MTDDVDAAKLPTLSKKKNQSFMHFVREKNACMHHMQVKGRDD
jgi:hypothetical protein